jgi:hypothetical protein
VHEGGYDCDYDYGGGIKKGMLHSLPGYRSDTLRWP